jgi:hypothetical protein
MGDGRDMRLSDRLPSDWKKRISGYRGQTAAHFKRVMKTLNEYEWMSQEERERAAFVIVEKEQLREQGYEEEDD